MASGSVGVLAFNADAVMGVESYQLGQVSKESSPVVAVAKLSHFRPSWQIKKRQQFVFSGIGIALAPANQRLDKARLEQQGADQGTSAASSHAQGPQRIHRPTGVDRQGFHCVNAINNSCFSAQLGA
jgi:hypothetical protein